MSAAIVWLGFNLRRNLGKRSFKLWALLYAGVVLWLKLGTRGSVAELATPAVLILTPFLCLFFGTGVLREEIEDQTLTYPFTRPVNRAWIYAARALAAAVPVAVLTIPGAFYIGLSAGPETASRLALAAAFSTVSYTALFALVGLLIRWPTWLGLAYLLFWEAGLSQVPGFFNRLTLITHVRAVAGLQPKLSRQLAAYYELPSAFEGVVVLLVVAVVSLFLGGQLVRRREFVITR